MRVCKTFGYQTGLAGDICYHTEEALRELGLGLFPELQYEFPWLFTHKEKSSWFTREEWRMAKDNNKNRPERVKLKRMKSDATTPPPGQ
jgi:hypothetical protein